MGLTARESMLNPRRVNRPETRDKTPGLFSTSTVSVCFTIGQLIRPRGAAFPERAFRAGRPATLTRMDGRLLVVEDDPQVRSMVVRTLRYEGFEVVAANDVASAMAAVRQAPPDCMLLDLLLPDGDGVELCEKLRASGARYPILMLTARDGLSDRIQGLESGADDYVVKPFSTTELVARVRALLRRSRSPKAKGALRFADVVLDPTSREVHRGDRRLELTPREFDLLAFLLSRPRTALTRADVLTGAWDYGVAVETNAVEVYVGYLRRKLEEAGEPRLIWTLRGVGYVLREETP